MQRVASPGRQPLDQLLQGPGGEPRGEPGVQAPRCPAAYQPVHLVWLLKFIEQQNFSPNLSMTDEQAGVQRGSGTCPRSHSISVTELNQERWSPASLGCHKNTSVQLSGMERKTTKKAASVRGSREFGGAGEAAGVQGEGRVPGLLRRRIRTVPMAGEDQGPTASVDHPGRCSLRGTLESYTTVGPLC